MAAFLVDANVPILVARALHDLDHDAIHVLRTPLLHAQDYVLFWEAFLQGRIFVTLNATDFQLLHGAWCYWAPQSRQAHSGVIALRQAQPPVSPRDMAIFIDAACSEITDWRRGFCLIDADGSRTFRQGL